MTVFDYQPPSKPNNFLEKIKHWWQSHITAKHYFLGGGLLILLAACLVIIFTNNNKTPNTSNTPNASITSTPDATSHPQIPAETTTEQSDSVCGLPGVSDSAEITGAFIDETTWTGGDRYLYLSKKYGPGINDPASDVGCYARTPQGAVLAALNFSALTADENLSLNIYKRTIPADRADTQSIIEKELRYGFEVPEGEQVSFDVLSYGRDEAIIAVGAVVANGYGGTTYAKWIMKLQWIEGDWFVALAPNRQDYWLSVQEVTADQINKMFLIEEAS